MKNLIFGKLFLFLIFSCIAENTLAASDGSGLQISAAVDIVGQGNTTAIGPGRNRVEAREAELMLFAPIDHLFDGTFSAAAHKENGESFFEIHEAFIASSKLIANSQLKIGQFFLGVGRLNQVHRHEWPFVSAPKVHEQFFGEEAATDSGAEVGYLLPVPFYLNLSLGLTDGWSYGHAHNDGERPKVSTHYVRLTNFFETFGDGGAQVGLNYLSRTSQDGVAMSLVGVDVVAKWKDSKVLKELIQSEFWFRTKKPENSKPEETFGMYVFPQYGFNSEFSFGVRGDVYTVVSLQDVTGSKVDNLDYAVVPTLSYRPSEFSTFKLSYNYINSKSGSSAAEVTGMIEAQATFILGSHPAHSF